MATSQVPYLNFARVVEYILCLPGTSAPVERVFSSIKNIWKTESANLQNDTLKSILLIKTNLNYSCVEFYQFLKKTPELLKQIASQEKYDFPSCVASSSTSIASSGDNFDTSKMSIETP